MAILAVTLLSGAMAGGQDFTVSIVGQWQSGQSQFKREGLPIVYCPGVDATKPSGQLGKPSSNCFFVVIRNTQKAAAKLTMDSSDWYDCLQFSVTDRSGKTYSVAPAAIDFAKNIPETWTFSSGGLRVVAVDFTSSAPVGQQMAWQGLQPALKEPAMATMTATFRYYLRYSDSLRKQISVTSKPTDVYLCPK